MVNVDIKKIVKEHLEAKKSFKEQGFLTDKLDSDQRKNDGVVAEIRGYIINRMVELENFLNVFLGTYFVEDYSKFHKFILSEEFFTLRQKVIIFGKIGYHKNKRFNGKYDGLTKILDELVSIRNLIAHGYFTHFTRPEIKKLKQKVPTKLNEEFKENFAKNLIIAIHCLDELDVDLRNSKH